MFKTLKLITERLNDLCETGKTLAEAIHEAITQLGPRGDLDERVATLERELELKLAELEALVLKADNKFKAARGAEERSRRRASRRDDEYDDELDEDVFDEPAGPMGNGRGGPAMPAVHSPQYPQPTLSAEDIARRAKA